MTKSRSFSVASSIGALTLMALMSAGCESTSSDAYSEPLIGPAYIQMAPSPPPAPYIEETQQHTSIGTTAWRPGHWEYDATGFHWVAGETIARPNPTAVWSPDHWINHTYGWAFVPGYWQ